MSTHLEKRWKQIQSAGGPDKYILRELRRRGVYRSYRPNIREIENAQQKKAAIKAARAEYAARSELRRFVWEARKATHIQFLGPDIFWNDFLKDDHFDPFQRADRISDSKLPSLETLEQLITFLQRAVPELTIPMLRGYCSHREVSLVCHYRQFSIPKKTGGTRKIWAPLPRLKAMQRLILTEIVEKMAVHGSAHGFVVGKSIYSNASEHTNSVVVVGVDLQDFFPTFTFPRVKGLFRSYGYPIGIATLLALLCTEAPRKMLRLGEETYYIAAGPRVLPQGSPASPALTNVMCMRLDRRMSQYALSNGWRYTRYADDLTFSQLDEGQKAPACRSLLRMLHEVTKSEGLRIHPNKTHIMSKGRRQEVTGLVVNGEQEPRVPKERRRMLRAALRNAQHNVTVEHALSIESLLGHSAFVYMAQPELGRSLLDAFRQLTPPATEK